MVDKDVRRRIHDLEVTVWVGKNGIESVLDEMNSQFGDRELIKVKFLRSAREESSITDLAADLANRVDATMIDTRGNTAIYRR